MVQNQWKEKCWYKALDELKKLPGMATYSLVRDNIRTSVGDKCSIISKPWCQYTLEDCPQLEFGEIYELYKLLLTKIMYAYLSKNIFFDLSLVETEND
jgi:hypothetical protein